jgi:AraC-like DNA-binding protein
MDPSARHLYNIGMLPPGFGTRVDTSGIMAGDPTWLWDHSGGSDNRHYLYWLIIGGNGRLDAGADHLDLRPGDCLLSPMSEPHRGRHGPRQRLHVMWAVFRYVDDRGKTVDPEPLPARHRSVENMELLDAMTRRLIEAHAEPAGAWASIHWMQAILVELARQDARPKLTGLELEQFRRIEAVCNEVRTRPETWLDVETMAAMCDYTSNHFIRVFKRYTGMTPNEYLIRTRIAEARRLLRSTSLAVGEVAEQLGYRDVYYFAKQFKSRVGASPSAYRRS